MPRYINNTIQLSGSDSNSELNVLMILTELDEVVIAYVESRFLNRQDILDILMSSRESSYNHLKRFMDNFHDNNLVVTGLILALEACNYHETVDWVCKLYTRSSHMDYHKLCDARKLLKLTKLNLVKFDEHLDHLKSCLSNDVTKVITDSPTQETLSPLDQYIESIISNFNELSNVTGIHEAIGRNDLEFLNGYMQSIVEPEVTDNSLYKLLDDPEVAEFVVSIKSGKTSYLDFCCKYDLRHPNQLALATFLDDNGY